MNPVGGRVSRIAMPIPDPGDISALNRSVDKVALELVLAEPGKDNGLLPINSLLSEIEEEVKRDGWPGGLRDGLIPVRTWIDAALTAGCLDANCLQRLQQWTEWIQGSLLALGAGEPVAPFHPSEGGPGPLESTLGVPAFEPVVVPAPEQAEEAILLNLENDRDLLREFTHESLEHLQNIELGVLTLEENPSDSATLDSIFRAFHTFKGGSGFLNLKPINRLAHELESLLDQARQNTLKIDSTVIDLILAGADTLKRFVSAIEAQLGGCEAGEAIRISIGHVLDRVRKVVQAGHAAERPTGAASRAPEMPLEFTFAQGGGIAENREPAEAQPEAAACEGRPGATAPAATVTDDRQAARHGGPPPRASGSGAAVKVDTQKLDGLVDLVGEMVIAQSLVVQDAGLRTLQTQQLTRNLAQLGRITRELQRVAMSLRMVPIRTTFQKMTRLVRDLGLKSGKQVELRMSGEETELDRTIVEEISDPLVHMIRNAMDHGIEAPDDRVAAGKPALGVIELRAYHQGGNIVVEVRDDGAGLRQDRILKKAIEKGILSPEARLSEPEIFALIFAPGFSTAEKVTDISGRGVGMDVVRRNIEKLRGKVEIESAPGKGSRFTIHLPLTLAIIDGMIVGVGQQRYILPTLAVRESFRPTVEMMSSLQGSEIVNVRGRLLPLIRLGSLFGIEARAKSPTEGIIIVVECDRESRCVLVDDLLGKQEVVIKSLGATFKQSVALAGAAILGDGRVGLILDVEGLVGSRKSSLAKAA